MTDLYVQHVDMSLSKSARRLQVFGIVFSLIGIGFVLIAILYNYFFFFAVVGFLAIGVLLTTKFNKTILSFEYGCSSERIVFSTTNVIGKTERKIEILTKDIDNFGQFCDLVSQNDYIMCPDTNSHTVKSLEFHLDDGKGYRILFTPDEYMSAMLNENVNGIMDTIDYDIL